MAYGSFALEESANAFFGYVVNMCIEVSLLSSVIPSSLTSLLSSIVSSQTSKVHRDHFLFHVNMTIYVLSALMLSPLEWHQFSIVFIVVCVRCQITSRSSPSARDMMSSKKAGM